MTKLVFMHHLDAVQTWAQEFGVHVHLASKTLALTLSHAGRQWVLMPRFVQHVAGKLSYTRTRQKDTTLVGWVTPQTPRLNLAQDKVMFKKFANGAGLLVPAGWNTGAALSDDFLIKKRQGSFGVDIQGPFKKSKQEVVLADGEFCEQFIFGKPLKAWCWSGRVVALEVIHQPYVLGDGRRTLSELANSRGSMDVRLPMEQAEAYLNWQGLRLDSVLADQQQAYLSFLYASPFHVTSREDSNVLQSVSDSVRFQLSRAAMLVLQKFATEHQKNVLYTLDGVLDVKGRVWFLEINSHPMVHPTVYKHMLHSLVFGG
jgi:hypothetical protein